MSKVVFNRHTFNNGVLTVAFDVNPTYAESMYIKKVELDELLDGEYEHIEDTGEVEQLTSSESSSYEDPNDGKPLFTHIDYAVVCEDGMQARKNHLVRAIIYFYVKNPQMASDLPCCMAYDGENWVSEEYFVDMYVYERQILDSIRLGCEDNCKVPNTLINSLLKLFSVQAAVDAHSPQMEMIFGKIACGNNKQKNFTTFSRNCNCNA